MFGVIRGTGSYVPEKKMSNHDLAELVDTNDQWIRERTGVVNRHIVTQETTSGMAIEASRRALHKAKIKGQEIDMILVATISSDVIMPNTACVVQEAIGASRAICMDVNSACSGFISAYNTAQMYIRAGMANQILVVGAESLSKLVDWTDRGTCILFGDGAGAVVVSGQEGLEDGRPFPMAMHADGLKGKALTCNTLWPKVQEEGKHFLQMNGQEVFKFAVRQVPMVIREVLHKMNMKAEEIDYFVLHQANQRIVEAVAKRLQVPLEKFPTNIAEYGNTSSASIPILLDEMNEKGLLVSGKKIVIAGFGAGLTWGATYLEWN